MESAIEKYSWSVGLQHLAPSGRSLACSPDYQLVASHFGKAIILLDSKTGRKLHTLQGHSDDINFVDVSPEGQIVASVSDDETVKLWCVKIGKELRTLQGDFSYLTEMVFSPDGQTLALFGFSRNIYLWNVNSGDDIRTLEGHAEDINSSSSPQMVRAWPLVLMMEQSDSGMSRHVKEV